ncbi:MAG TPA: protein phosphatase 2C domain-containing protein [Planctomycetota bacterium]|nr:protein phosphatase 2C domain-containing protein [Planctomycetota bacterium]
MSFSPRPDCFGRTDPGLVRETNEDQFLVAELTKSMLVHETSLDLDESTRLSGGRPGFLFLVADGLGGRPAGEQASRLAVEGVLRSVLGTLPWFTRPDDRPDDLVEDLEHVLEQGQRCIEADAQENPSREGMATTLTMAYVRWPRLTVVHVGDSRAYLHRSGRLEQLTTDHTFEQPMRDSGSGSEAVKKKVLWNVIGGKGTEVSPDVIQVTLEPGDELLLATDGLSEELPQDQIARILDAASDARDACRRLLHEATSAGGGDNITVVDARWPELRPEERPAAADRAEARPETPVDLEPRGTPEPAGAPEPRSESQEEPVGVSVLPGPGSSCSRR